MVISAKLWVVIQGRCLTRLWWPVLPVWARPDSRPSCRLFGWADDGLSGGFGGCQVDVVAQFGDEAVPAPVGVISVGEVVPTEVAVDLAWSGHDVLGDDQDLVRHPDRGLGFAVAIGTGS